MPPVSAVEMLRSARRSAACWRATSSRAIDVPAHDNSAMDGYALRGADLRADARHRARSRSAPASPAGSSTAAVAPRQCVRIMTGAVMPAGLDTVVPQEFVARRGRPCDGPGRRGAHAATTGAWPAKTWRAAKRRCAPAACCARPTSACWRRSARPRCRCCAACAWPSSRPATNCARSASRSTPAASTTATATRCGPCCSAWASTCSTSASCATNRPRSRLRSAQAAGSADAVITSGGVSVGEADHTKQVMASSATCCSGASRCGPGRPMAIGRIGSDGATGAILFGLPGNPVAVMVTFYAFVRDALLAMSGATREPLPLLRAASARRSARSRAAPSTSAASSAAAPTAAGRSRITGSQGSGILRSMSEANGLVVLHHEQGNVAAGEPVDVLPFDGLI